MQEYLVGVYQEVGKKPDIIKIRNDKTYLEKLVGGEFTTLDYDDYIILYKKDNERLLPNIYVSRFSKIGLAIKGKIFIIGKDENNNFISLNKGQFKRCSEFLLRESFNYKNFDEKGRYIPKMMRKNKNNKSKFNKSNVENKKDIISQEKQKIEFTTKSISNNDIDIAQGIKVEPAKKEDSQTQTNENIKTDTNIQNSTDNISSTTPVIRLSDEETLQVLNRMVYIIYDYLQKLMEIMSNNDE